MNWYKNAHGTSESDLRNPERQADGVRFISFPNVVTIGGNALAGIKLAVGRRNNANRLDYNCHRYVCTKASALIRLYLFSAFL